MNTRFLLALLVALAPANGLAQKLEKITGVQLEYWRAFHGLIKQEVLITSDGKIALNTTITPPRKDGDAPPKGRHTVKIIARNDLAPLLTFFNSTDAREYFAATSPDDRLDGAALSITVMQNSFSISFSTQDAFTRGGPRYVTGLGRLAIQLFALAGITIPEGELY